MKIEDIKNGDRLYDPELGFSVLFVGPHPFDKRKAVTLVGEQDLSMDDVSYLETLEVNPQ